MSKNKKETRFHFGENWRNYISKVDTNKIESARSSLISMIGTSDLSEKKFIDIGSGSGIFSLSAKMMGANVVSFDYDENSVYCTNELKKIYFSNDSEWQIMRGDILDKSFLMTLEKYDIVYSWGVLHHTGDMWGSIDNSMDLVKDEGQLYIALYNDQGMRSKYWTIIKYLYSRFFILRPFLILLHLPYPFLASLFWRLISNRLELNRGMTYWVDYIDWLGGYPFEVSKPKDVVQYIESKGFVLEKQVLCGSRSGCNEFVFKKKSIL